MLAFILTLITPATLLVAAIALCITYYVTTMPRYLNMPPGPHPLPILGNILDMFKKPNTGHITVFESIAKKYGTFCSLKLGNCYAIIISDYRLLQECYVKKSEFFSDRPVNSFYVMKTLNARLGAGIITNNGPAWKSLRRTALMTMRDFGVGKQSLEEKIQDEARFLLDKFSEQKGKPFVTKPWFNKATSNVISGIIFGSRFDYEDETFNELLNALDRSFSINPIFTPVNFFPLLAYIPYFKKSMDTFSRTINLTSEYVKSLTETHESTFDPENIRDFVDLFIKMRREEIDKTGAYDKGGMGRVIVDLFTAGSDTTANTLSWLMIYMAEYPEIQTQCQQQIDEVLGKGKLPTLADREKLPLVEATILEVLRIRPATPVGAPHSANRDLEIRGYHIPKDTTIFANIAGINKDPEIFPNPDKFDPGHFLSDDGKVINRDRLLTFSMGPRSCLGEILAKMELSIFFASILQFFTISPESGKSIDLNPYMSLILRHQVQNVVLTRRE